MVEVRVPTHLSARQRELLEQLATEMGETEEPTPASDAAGVPKPNRAGRRRRRRGLGDRIRDAIS